MRLLIALLAVLALPLASGSVIELSWYSVAEFRSELDNYDTIFIKFFAPFCGHCKAMAKDFVKLGQELLEEDPPITLAEVDCTSDQGQKICKKYNVKGYPTLQLFRLGKPEKQYEGVRTMKAMKEWLAKNARVYSKRFASYSELNQAIKSSNNPIAVAILDYKDTDLVDMWLKGAKAAKEDWTYREVDIFHVLDEFTSGKPAQLKSLGLKDEPRPSFIVLKRPKWLETKHEPTVVRYKVGTKQDIAEWIKQHAFGTLVRYKTRNNEDHLRPPLIVAYFDLDLQGNPTRTHKWRNKLMESAKQHLDINFAIASSQSFRKNLRRQGIEAPKGDEPPLIIGYDALGAQYVMRDEFTDGNFAQFIADYKEGAVSPHIKSEDPPEDNDSRMVKQAVGANFHKLVTTNEKDVLIDFYAPWCKHSQELEPTWEELARQFRNEPGLDIVKMDATANTVPDQFEVKTYPTVYFVPKNSKKPILYNRGRLIHEFIQFVAQHSTDELKTFHRDGSIKTKIEL